VIHVKRDGSSILDVGYPKFRMAYTYVLRQISYFSRDHTVTSLKVKAEIKRSRSKYKRALQ
jgi:hypothetical protein